MPPRVCLWCRRTKLISNAIGDLQVHRRVRCYTLETLSPTNATKWTDESYSVQVNIPAESGEMGVLANHVPSIEQLKPGLIEVIEEAGGSKQFFCMQCPYSNLVIRR